MSYVGDSLGPGETIVHEATIHWIVYFWPIVAVIVGLAATVLAWPYGLAVLAAAALWLLVAWFLSRTTELAVTSRKVVAKWGLVARSTIEQRLEKVDSISVDQTFLGRVLNFGNVTVHGTGINATPIKMIADPLVFRRKVEQAIEARRDVG
ncbi:PH domain-containing protein [Phreatobacter oligotrophus]|uniref:PH (Pleckstrin Homology) domain-containing protein n=1 Tax=Phreatobacter oligotrophus TaxID=1122261 RepID=A0A2T4Z0B5_9HYPH|nr:PH domain-containing protein [Phreatobacter oligotrophus]PTM52930.1 PH (Pleckstrin Homology) domain-containing protein [Phreatobacter oligotrophus]